MTNAWESWVARHGFPESPGVESDSAYQRLRKSILVSSDSDLDSDDELPSGSSAFFDKTQSSHVLAGVMLLMGGFTPVPNPGWLTAGSVALSMITSFFGIAADDLKAKIVVYTELLHRLELLHGAMDESLELDLMVTGIQSKQDELLLKQANYDADLSNVKSAIQQYSETNGRDLPGYDRQAWVKECNVKQERLWAIYGNSLDALVERIDRAPELARVARERMRKKYFRLALPAPVEALPSPMVAAAAPAPASPLPFAGAVVSDTTGHSAAGTGLELQ